MSTTTLLTLSDAARLALQCLDLTSLNDNDSSADIETLCRRAQTPHGNVAAVCVWPRFVAQARAALPADVRVAAVANFPDGSADIARVRAEVAAIGEAGAQEVDVVLPYRALQQGQADEVAEFLQEVRYAAEALTLKVILETGELREAGLIADATRLCLAAGADFVKTSTGKTAQGASAAAARTMLEVLKASGISASGFKASGGVRSVADAQIYIQLVSEILGPQALGPRRLRLGASSLLDDIERVLGGAAAPAATAGAANTY
ncbi:deoxyribose-phosphate aldolase [Roseateles sp. BYS180W]|uniref:Deoxyribose-phosphate aldolase n=1 Tax=Roseateles rivi TaxID=3299028 RepID=A0ABW7FSX0_9BURK